MYTLTTNVLGNPDLGQNPQLRPYGVRNVTFTAATLPELKQLVREWQGENQIGGGNWQPAACKSDGHVIGWMSYNGRVWANKESTPDGNGIVT